LISGFQKFSKPNKMIVKIVIVFVNFAFICSSKQLKKNKFFFYISKNS